MAVIGPIGFTGGLNRSGSQINLGSNQMTDSINCFIEYNTVKKINSTRVINTDQSGVSGEFVQGINALVQWRDPTVPASYIVIEGADVSDVEKTRYIVNSGFGSMPAASTSISTGALGTLHKYPCFASFNGKLIRVNDADTTGKWIGAGNNWAVLGGTPPSGHTCAVASNYLFIGNLGTSSTSRIQWSNAGDPETWDAGNILDFNKQDGDSIEGLCELGSNLLIMKNNSFGLLNLSAPQTIGTATVFSPLSTIRKGLGLAWREAWDYIDRNTIVFVGSDNHIYIFDGNSFIDISNRPPPNSNIQKDLDDAVSGGLGISALNPIVRYYPTRNQIWVLPRVSVVPGAQSGFVYNINLGVWETRLTYCFPGAMIVYRSLNNETGLFRQYSLVSALGSSALVGGIGEICEHDYPIQSSIAYGAGVTISVDLFSGGSYFKPLSVLLPASPSYAGASASADVINIIYQYNNKTNSLSYVNDFRKTLSIGTSNYMNLLRFGLVSNINNPYSIQIRFDNGANDSIGLINTNVYKFAFHPFFISDEVFV